MWFIHHPNNRMVKNTTFRRRISEFSSPGEHLPSCPPPPWIPSLPQVITGPPIQTCGFIGSLYSDELYIYTWEDSDTLTRVPSFSFIKAPFLWQHGENGFWLVTLVSWVSWPRWCCIYIWRRNTKWFLLVENWRQATGFAISRCVLSRCIGIGKKCRKFGWLIHCCTLIGRSKKIEDSYWSESMMRKNLLRKLGLRKTGLIHRCWSLIHIFIQFLVFLFLVSCVENIYIEKLGWYIDAGAGAIWK